MPTLPNGPGVVAHTPVSFLSNLFMRCVVGIPTSSAALVIGTRPMAGAGPCSIISDRVFSRPEPLCAGARVHQGQQRKLTGRYAWLLVLSLI